MNQEFPENPAAVRPLGLGTWLSSGSPVIADLAADCGFDWLLFDLEHGCLTEAALLSNLQAARRPGVELIVRVGSPDPALIARVLDWGAGGIMLPHVSDPEQAEACVAAMQYPPRGRRGYSGTVRAFGYGLRTPVDHQPLRPPRLLVQIEDREGVRQAEAIARVVGVDVLFVGPADLKLDLSLQDSGRSFTYGEALEEVSRAAEKHRRQAGILVRDKADLPSLQQLGFSCLAVDSDLGILRNHYRALVGKE